MVVAYVYVILFSASVIDAKIGINWGRQSSTNLVPSMVVDLLLQNQVTEVKLYNVDDDVIKAFGGTQIGVTISIPKPEIIDSLDIAKQWVRTKVAPFPTVNIRYVVVGNNAFAVARFNKTPFETIVRALVLVQNALDELGFGERVKAILTHSYTGVLKVNYTRPSEAEFVDEVKEPMAEVLRIAYKNKAPFMYDVFPISFVRTFSIDPNFGFFDNKSSYVVTDKNGLRYNNFFDFVHDSFAWALQKAGCPDIKIVVGQIGWPTDGYSGATAASAERFYRGLLPLVTSDRGTPLRPGAPIDVYIHSLTDEKKNPVSLPFMRHWGIYMTNGQPKFKIDLSGQGRDVYPTTAKGIHLMPSRWCMFNGIKTDEEKVKRQFEFACSNADCTSLAPGGSCGMLDPNEVVSYAFNAYFQSHFQDESACTFEGLGDVVVKNPSRDGCLFIVEVVKGNQQPVEEPTKWG